MKCRYNILVNVFLSNADQDHVHMLGNIYGGISNGHLWLIITPYLDINVPKRDSVHRSQMTSIITGHSNEPSHHGLIQTKFYVVGSSGTSDYLIWKKPKKCANANILIWKSDWLSTFFFVCETQVLKQSSQNSVNPPTRHPYPAEQKATIWNQIFILVNIKNFIAW